MDNKDRNSFIKNLIEIFNKNNLNSLEFKDGDLEIKLKKNLNEGQILQTRIEQPFISQQITPLSPSAPNNVKDNSIGEESSSASNYVNHEGVVKSPTVGVIYTKPQPNDKPFVNEGVNVKEGDTLFLLEVMKVFTPIKAHKSGVIKKILVKDNDIVEYNEVLAIIE